MLRRGRYNLRQRRGTAAVEAALVLPVFVLIILASIEACTMIYLRQSLEIAAYEGARVTIVPGTNTDNVIGTCQTICTNRGVVSPTVTITPSSFDTAVYGTFIKVTVTASCSSNGYFPSWFYSGKTLVGEAQMMREY